MRQGQQNKQRARRNNNGGRKNSNSASRSYDSNGPDVKIRGTAAHVAEKYNSLARDALSSGDIVMAENYFQHAEHYSRIVASLQQQQMEKRVAQTSLRTNGDAGEAIDSQENNGSDLSDAPQPSLDLEVLGDNGNAEIGEKTETAASDAAVDKPVKRRPRRTMRRPRPADIKVVEKSDGQDAVGEKSAVENDDDNAALPAFLLS